MSTTSVLTAQVENSQGTKLIKFWGDSVCYTTLLLAKAVCDRRKFISHPVGDQAHGTPPTPKQRLNRQILTPDSRSISWTLRTSEDETARISTMTGSEPFRDVIVFFSSAYVCVLLQPHTSINVGESFAHHTPDTTRKTNLQLPKFTSSNPTRATPSFIFPFPVCFTPSALLACSYCQVRRSSGGSCLVHGSDTSLRS